MLHKRGPKLSPMVHEAVFHAKNYMSHLLEAFFLSFINSYKSLSKHVKKRASFYLYIKNLVRILQLV